MAKKKRRVARVRRPLPNQAEVPKSADNADSGPEQNESESEADEEDSAAEGEAASLAAAEPGETVASEDDPEGDGDQEAHEAQADDEPRADDEPQADDELRSEEESQADDDVAPASGVADLEDLVLSGEESEVRGEGVFEDESGVEDTEGYLKGLVEAILFSSDRPQSSRDVARAARLDKGRVEELIEMLLIETKDRGVRLVEVSEGYAFRTNPAYSSYIREFLAQRPVRLSRAQLETLAIIAYRQPITRPEVDDIRGVDSGGVLKTLLERELVRILGKKDEPGRPMIYGTAPAFLDLFSLNSLRDLPTLREFTELSEDSRAKFELEIGEPAPEGPIEFPEDKAFPEKSVEDEAGADSATPDDANPTDGDSPIDEASDSEPESDRDGDPDSAADSDGAADLEESRDAADMDSDEMAADEIAADEMDPEDDVAPLNAADEEEFPDDEDDDDDDEDEDDEDDEDEDEDD